MQKITPFLWFDDQIEAALELYSSLFEGSKIESVSRQGERVFTAELRLAGQRFSALNGGPMFRFSPATSLFVVCETEAEIDAAWAKLIDGGTAMMPLQAWPWSEKYGWAQDRFGLSWQLMKGEKAAPGAKISPTLMFTDAQHGRCEEAIAFWSSLFEGSKTEAISRYEKGDADPAEGTVKHAQFWLGSQKFRAMDSSMMHGAGFNEAFSFVVWCETQAEVDFFWQKLTENGGSESQCAWLKDRFGVSWQIVPTVLPRLLGGPNAEKRGAAMQAMLQMRKIEIDVLQAAFDAA